MNSSRISAPAAPASIPLSSVITATASTLANYSSSNSSLFANNSTIRLSSTTPITSYNPSTQSVASSLCSSFQYEFHTNIPGSVICGLCFIIGIFMVLVGYRAFKVSMFIIGLSLTSLLTYLILSNRAAHLKLHWNASIAGGTGLVCGIICALVPIMGLIMASMSQAFFFMAVTASVVYLFTTDHTFWICVGTVIGLSILFTALAIARQRKAAIVYITSFGAILIMLALDYYLDMFMVTKYAYRIVFRLQVSRPCWFSWTVFGVWPCLVALGCCVQFLKTAKGFDHRQKKVKSKGTKYKSDSTGRSRRLYDNGDVIAQAWIQTSEDTLEKRKSFTPVYDYESPDDKESTTLV
eukprot:gene3011-3469_t